MVTEVGGMDDGCDDDDDAHSWEQGDCCDCCEERDLGLDLFEE